MGPQDQKPVFLQIAEYVADCPNGAGRLQVANQFGITKSTAIEHLEKCVKRGLLHKAYTWIGAGSRGWIYFHSRQSAGDPDADYIARMGSNLTPLETLLSNY